MRGQPGEHEVGSFADLRREVFDRTHQDGEDGVVVDARDRAACIIGREAEVDRGLCPVANNGHRTWTDFMNVEKLINLDGCGIEGDGTQNFRTTAEGLGGRSRGEFGALHERGQCWCGEEQARETEAAFLSRFLIIL